MAWRPQDTWSTRRRLDVHPNLPPVPWLSTLRSSNMAKTGTSPNYKSRYSWENHRTKGWMLSSRPCLITGGYRPMIPTYECQHVPQTRGPNHTGSGIWAPHCFAAALLAMIVAPREAAVHETWKARLTSNLRPLSKEWQKVGTNIYIDIDISQISQIDGSQIWWWNKYLITMLGIHQFGRPSRDPRAETSP